MEEEILRESFRQKTWSEQATKDSWMVFKIMGEIVSGYEKMQKMGPCVSIFGSARIKPDTKYYKMTEEIAQKITELGFGVITGGGPGIMEAGNKGAKENGGKSAKTHIKVLERNYEKNITFLEARLYTGRTHQIRAHLSLIGHSLVGDELYGGNMEIAKRQMLHAFKLEFQNPKTLENLKIEIDIPIDMKEVLK